MTIGGIALLTTSIISCSAASARVMSEVPKTDVIRAVPTLTSSGNSLKIKPINVGSAFTSSKKSLEIKPNTIKSVPTAAAAVDFNRSNDLIALPAQVNPQEVPEPFTIIGTIIGGTAAFRMKKKLNSTTKM
jgi:hypothetical protein